MKIPLKTQGLLIDIMMGNRFYCQLNYISTGRLQIVNGKCTKIFNAADIQKFVESSRPELKSKP